MAQDRSRSAFDVRQPKHWSSLQAQQGRLLSDDDWNEADAIDKEDIRYTRAEVIGPSGSPDDGFKVSNPSTNANGIDFDLAPGTMYVGGLRVTLEQPPGQKQPEAFALQKDWLQQTAADRPALGNVERIDFVYLEVWQQPVTAVEDDELREVALGGPDTSVRLRTMRRVRVLPNVGTENCSQAWATLTASLGHLSSDNERSNYGALTVNYVPNNGPAPNLCSPSSQAGYLGAENQAIRIEIGSGGNTLLWGYDNASPLYRVQVTNDAQGAQVIHFLTTPKDEVHWPLAQQIVELLPWSAVLPNGQKVAETSGGFLTRVSASYDPGTQNIKVTPTVPAAFGSTWQGRADQASLSAAGGSYYYLRVWNRGADVASLPEIPFNVGVPVELAGTGISVTLGGLAVNVSPFRQGDFWIIAARPESPAKVVPWKLESGRLAEGIRSFYAPLGIIHWRPANGQHTFFDCRPPFDNLVELTARKAESCACTVCVTPQQHSSGKLSLQTAINMVIKAGGGTICLEAGVYGLKKPLFIGKARSLRLVGKGVATALQSASTAIEIADSQDVTLESFSVSCSSDKASSALRLRSSSQLRVEHLQIDVKGKTGSAIGLSGALASVAIRNNRTTAPAGVVTLADQKGDAVGLSDLRIEDNEFTCSNVAIKLTGSSVHQQVSRIAGNRITKCAEAALVLTGATVPGFGIEVSGNELQVLGDGVVAGVNGLRISDNDIVPLKASGKQRGIVLTKGMTGAQLDDVQIVGNRIANLYLGIAVQVPLGSVAITRNQISAVTIGLQTAGGPLQNLSIDCNQMTAIAQTAIEVRSTKGRVAARGNQLQIEAGTGVIIICKEGDCLFADNHSVHGKSSKTGAVSLRASRLVFTSNRIEGKAARVLLEVDIRRTPQKVPELLCTVVGNITGEAIQVNGLALPAPWAPLNLQNV